jgi:hypothetical protein
MQGYALGGDDGMAHHIHSGESWKVNVSKHVDFSELVVCQVTTKREWQHSMAMSAPVIVNHGCSQCLESSESGEHVTGQIRQSIVEQAPKTNGVSISECADALSSITRLRCNRQCGQ